MDDKWIEITVLAGTNVLTLVIVALINIIASYCTRNEDTERHHRKYTVTPVTPAKKHSSVAPKNTIPQPTENRADTVAVEESSKSHGGSAQKKHI